MMCKYFPTLKYSDTFNKKHRNHHNTYWHYTFNGARLRVLRLENVPDSDASPFSNGDFYMNAWLESQKFRVEPLEPVGGSKYGRAQFQPVSARESVKVQLSVCLLQESAMHPESSTRKCELPCFLTSRYEQVC